MAIPSAPYKRSRSSGQPQPPLLPGLPDHLASLCLCHVPPRLLFSVCRSWRRLLYSTSVPPFLSLYALLSDADDSSGTALAGFSSYDPFSASWSPLPPPPSDVLRRILLRHPSFLSRHLPVQTVSASGHLVLLSATSHPLRPALPRALAFHPATRRWRPAPPLSAPRRWCAAGSVGGVVYVASGVGAHYSQGVARCAERWDPMATTAGWERVAPLKDGRFSREAAHAVGFKGKLYMVNVWGKAAKEGIVYDVEGDAWEEMPRGLLEGWNGPTASMEEREIYTVDEGTGTMRVYDCERDRWMDVIESEALKGAVHMAAGGGRVCVVCEGGDEIAVVDVAANKMWKVEPPQGNRVVSVHVLPRMSSSSDPDFVF
ncbi:putative F-box/kelch-repeat protein [Acorus gramineus]|uniref:F-box/kelch-repeat protein n=1 Tax=Acorus gramineus TaxID=55184 RepID=A0AAV9AC10_ACOGR|nr:putative F-box/kelch-repeat protein [Acorus gramineus]